MSRLNLKFKIFSELLVGDMGGGQSSFHCPGQICKLKIFSELLIGDNCGFNHLSMSGPNHKLKIFSELLSSCIGGVNHLFHVQAKS